MTNIAAYTRIEKEGLFATGIANNDFNVFEQFINVDTSDKVLNNDLALKVSLEKGALLFALKIIQNNSLSTNVGIATAYRAIQNGHLDLVNELLKNSYISPHKGQLFGLAAKCGYLDLVKTLGSEQKVLSSQKEIALVDAAEHGHLAIVEYILSKEEGASEGAIERAVIRAAGALHLDILRCLISTNKIPPKSHAQQGALCILCTNVKDNYLDIIRDLLKIGPIDELTRGQCVIATAKKGDLDVLKLLLENGPISNNSREKAVCHAAEQGYLEVVRTLLENGPISDEKRQDAVQAATENGHLPVLQRLLQDHPLTSAQRPNLVLVASSRAHRDILEFLLHLGPIPVSVRGSAITLAGAMITHTSLIDPLAGINARQAILELLEMALVIPDHITAEARFYDNNTLYTTYDEVTENPARFLSLVITKFPRRVVLTNSPRAIDLGGITKQFITTLVNALIEKKVIKRNDQLLPVAESEEDALHIRQIGMFYSSLFERNKDRRMNRFLIGNLFHLQFFDLVKIALNEGSPEDKLKQIAALVALIEPALTKAKDVVIDPTAENISAYRLALGDDKADPRDMFIGYLKAAEAFATGLTEELQAQILTNASIPLMTTMQGQAITKAKVKAACQVIGDAPAFIQQARWLIEVIEESNDLWLKEFIFCITGNDSLPEGLTIQIAPNSRNAFEIHTCCNSINIPNIPHKELFIAGLKAAITDKTHGYNIA